MTLRWMEGFEIDANSTNMPRKYENFANWSGVSTGRLFGSSAQSHPTSPGVRFRTPSLGSTGTWIVGFAYKPGSTSGEQKVVSIQDNNNEQIALYHVVAGSTCQWRVKRGSTVLGTTTNAWTNGFWHYVEFKVVLDTNGSNGMFEVRVNEISELLVENTDTTNQASTTANKVEFTHQTVGTQNYMDDIYICDGLGAKNNSYLGDSIVEGMLPSAEGNRCNWTPSSSTNNATLVDDTTLDDDATYNWVANTADGVVDLYVFPNITTIVGAVYGVQVNFSLRMDTSGSDKVRVIMRNGSGGEATSPTDWTINQTAGYKWFQEIIEQDLTISGDWTVANFNAMEFGLESRP